MPKKVGDRNNDFVGRALGHRIRETHTRFHAWNYTEFSKIIYLDADLMLLTTIDKRFDLPDDFAATPCARPGVIDPCFNAGLLVLRPHSKVYQELMNFWRESTESVTCINVQMCSTCISLKLVNGKHYPVHIKSDELSLDP